MPRLVSLSCLTAIMSEDKRSNEEEQAAIGRQSGHGFAEESRVFGGFGSRVLQSTRFRYCSLSADSLSASQWRRTFSLHGQLHRRQSSTQVWKVLYKRRFTFVAFLKERKYSEAFLSAV